jgi:hypothetical protein
MSLKILFPDDIEELAIALDGISEATAQAARDGSESLKAFRLGVQVAMAAVVKATGGQPGQPIKPRDPMDRLNRVPRLTSPCPLKGICAEQSNGYYCRFYRGRCPMLANPGYNYLTCPGWHNYEAERRQHACYG